MTKKQRLKLELYSVLLNTPVDKITDNEAQILHHLAVDDETTDALTKRARRDYATMCHAAKIKPKTFRAINVVVKAGKLYMKRAGAVKHAISKDACSAAGCGCLHFRPKSGSMVHCLCSHLTHDHYLIRYPTRK